MSLLVGTSGYSYDDWIGPFYEEGTKKRDFLEIYSRTFAFTELNFSYYKMPTPGGSESLAARVPDHFRFSVKAHRTMTHDRDSEELSRNVETFARGIAPIREHGKLAAVLVQFPYSFHYSVDNRRYLDALVRELHSLPTVLEFRNEEWLNRQALDGMRERGISLVLPDLPPLERLPLLDPARDALPVTGPIAYVRFHGRNSRNWWSGDNVSRYDYDYSEEELRPWSLAVFDLVRRAEHVIVAFNNHANAQAVFNAKLFQGMLEEPG